MKKIELQTDKYLFTKGNMPIVYETAAKMLTKTNKKVALSLPLTWETLCLIDAIKSKIPNLIIIPQSSGENSSTQPGVFPYLKKWGINHYFTAEEKDRIKVLKQKPDVIVDCSFVLGEAGVRNNLLSKDTILIEDTKTGENRIEELGLKNSYIILDNSNLKREYENRFGIGYSVIGALVSMGFFLPKYKIGVIGYGKVGEGVARFARLLGAQVAVCEIDEARKKEAAKKYQVMSKEQLLKTSDIIITAAGKNVLLRKDFTELDKKIFITNAGGEDEWIREEMFAGCQANKIHPFINEFQVGKCIVQEIGGGNSVNLAVGVSISEFLDVTFSHLILVLNELKSSKLKLGKNEIEIFENDYSMKKMESLGAFVELTGSLWQWNKPEPRGFQRLASAFN